MSRFLSLERVRLVERLPEVPQAERLPEVRLRLAERLPVAASVARRLKGFRPAERSAVPLPVVPLPAVPLPAVDLVAERLWVRPLAERRSAVLLPVVPLPVVPLPLDSAEHLPVRPRPRVAERTSPSRRRWP
ncbi:MAG: hypothetical protein AB8I08_24485 [Sandaracinaceae bacterium]